MTVAASESLSSVGRMFMIAQMWLRHPACRYYWSERVRLALRRHGWAGLCILFFRKLSTLLGRSKNFADR